VTEKQNKPPIKTQTHTNLKTHHQKKKFLKSTMKLQQEQKIYKDKE